MPEIPVTETQRERLEAVRRDVEEAYVDTYGHARPEDAIQYLLDTYVPPENGGTVDAYDRIATAEYPVLQRVASDVPDVPGSGIDADEMRGRLLSELGPRTFAARLEEVDTGASDVGTAATPRGKGEETPTDGATATNDSASDSPLATVKQLLREHEDRWHESDGDMPYEVELPDGTTESARTKDDVRQLLFRHYS